MSDSEHDSRALAVGRKRNRPGKYTLSSSTAGRADGSKGNGSRGSGSNETTSRRSSLESGEIGSSGESRAPSPEVYDKYGPDFIRIDFQIPKRRRLTASTSGSVFDEDRRPSKVVPVVESSDEGEMTPEPHAMASSTPLEGIRLCEISYKDLVEQELYFDLNCDKYPDDLVYCLCCGGRGHMKSTCSESACKHCGAKKEHTSYACPIFRKCRLCRQRGHDPSECTNPASTSGTDPCDVCQQTGHVEEECPQMWSTSLHPDPTHKIRKIPDKEMTRACYSCGSNYHWGDDCQYSDRVMPRSLVKTWSKEFATQYVIEHDSEVKTVGEQSSSEVKGVNDEQEEKQVPSASGWQFSMLEGGRD